MAVTAVTAERLNAVNATKLLDIATVVPGLSIISQTGAPGSVTIAIRGISTSDVSSTTIGTTVDDVPVNSSSANAFAGYAGLDLLPFNVGGIEILKGPQGTLYGASSLGGLLKYVTPTPSLTEASFTGGGEINTVAHSKQIGNNLRVGGSIPLIDGKLAITGSFQHIYTPGYIDAYVKGENDYNHGTQDGGRIGLLWTPTDALTVKLTAIIQKSDFWGSAALPLNPATNQPFDGYYRANYPLENRSQQDTQIYIGKLTYDMDWATLTSVTGYSHLESKFLVDLSDASYSIALGINGDDTYLFRTNKFTQELRLASPDNNALTWQIGTFYTKETSFYDETATPYDKVTGAVLPDFMPYYFSTTDSNFKEYAVFGNIGYKFGDQFEVSAGLRYAKNDQEASSRAGGFLQGGNVNTPVFKSSDSKITYAVDARYHVNRDVMLYGRIATGYRPGGANLLEGVPPTFEPDTTTNYELGIKSELFDRRLLFNVSTFLIDWSKIHVLERVGALDTYTGNGGQAQSKGVEFDIQYRVTPEFMLGVNGGYTDAKLTAPYVRLNAPSGYSLPNTPKWTGSLFTEWNHDLGNDVRLNVGGAWLYVGKRNSDFPASRPPSVVLKEYDTINLHAGVNVGNWSLRAYVRNLADRQAYVARRNRGPVTLTPRTIGVSAEVSF